MKANRDEYSDYFLVKGTLLLKSGPQALFSLFPHLWLLDCSSLGSEDQFVPRITHCSHLISLEKHIYIY